MEPEAASPEDNSRQKEIQVLIHEQTLYRALLENSAEAIVLCDGNAVVRYQNSSAFNIVGYRSEEVIGTSAFDYVHPGDLDDAKALFKELFLMPGVQRQKQYRLRHKSGHYFWIESTVTNLLHQPNVCGFIISYRDITLRKQAEEVSAALTTELKNSLTETSDYKYALDASSIVTIVNADGTIKYVNDNFCKLSKFSSEEIIGQNPRIFNSGYHSKAFFKNLWDTVLAGNIWKGELRNKTKDGGFYWGDTTIVPFLDTAGKPYQFLVIRNNITERKKAEELLKENIIMFREFFESAHEAITVGDMVTGEIIDCNTNAHRAFGYERNEFLQKMLWELSPGFQPDGSNSLLKSREYLDRAGAGEKVVFEWVYQDAFGNRMYCEVRLTKLNIPGRNLVRASIIDISEKKHAQELILQAKANLSTILNNADTAYVLLDYDLNIVSFNELARTWTPVFMQVKLEEQKNAISNLKPAIRMPARLLMRKVLSGEKIDYESFIDKPDGTTFHYHLRMYGIRDEKGNLYGLCIAVSDINMRKQAENELKESEKKYRSLFENMQEGIAYCEMIYEQGEPVDFVYVDVNDKFGELTHLKNVVGKKVTEIIPGVKNQDDEIFKIYSRVVKTGKSEKFEYCIKAMSMWFSLNVYHTGGNFFVAVFDVIDERKKSEAQILELNESLEKKVAERTAELADANRELEAFSYTVSHDLQSPLRIVNGFVKILLEDHKNHLDSDAQEHLHIIGNSVQRMSQLIKELLAFAKLGKVPLARLEVDMSSMVHEIVDEARLSNPGMNAGIIVQGLPPAYCDAGLMKQVWVNLILNAIKYSGKREQPLIEIGFNSIEGITVYYIKDNGAGFDMKFANKLFGVFKRLHTDSEFEGTGVGLALVHRIVTRHGGKIWAEAKVNEGATFYFTLV